MVEDVELEMTNLQVFVRALYEAHGASEMVDRFDLREDEASGRRWHVLLAQQEAAFRALHAVCRRVPVDDLL